tara:strand:+ start:102 stop:917 length:816 start_codon:yes stop_codon:yes gene_type:complete
MSTYVEFPSEYVRISDFGKGAGGEQQIDNPLSYTMNSTLDQKFLHGNIQLLQNGQMSQNGQFFLANYGAAHFDEFCVYASMNQYAGAVVSVIDSMIGGSQCSELVGRYNPTGNNLTAGEIVIRNAAIMRYLKKMIGGKPVYQPFDPTVADSPIIMSYIPNTLAVGGTNNSLIMTPIYGLTAEEIDNIDRDPLMLYCVQRSWIAGDVLLGIYINLRLHNGNNKLLDKLLSSNSTLANWMNSNSEMLNYYYNMKSNLVRIYSKATNCPMNPPQ